MSNDARRSEQMDVPAGDTTPSVEEILEPLVAPLRSWTDSELRGTTYYETELKSIEDDKAKVIAAINALRRADMEYVIGENEAPKPKPGSKYRHERLGTCWPCYEYDCCVHEKRDDLRAEQRTRMNDRLNGKGEKG